MTVRFRLLYRTVFWITLFTVLTVCSTYGAKLTDEERAYIKRKGSIIFVSQTRYPPFEFVNTQGQHEGMMLDVVRWLAVEMSFQPVFTDMSFQKAQEAVLSGKADVLTSLFYSDKRNERFEFTDTLFDVPASIFVKAERTDINNLTNLNGKTIAMQAGDYAKEFLESKGIKCEVLETKDFGEATDMVIAGKADAVIGDEQIVLYHIFSNWLTEHVKKVGEPLYIGKDCMAGSKANAVLIRILNKGVEQARQAGVLDKISKKWLGTRYGPQETWMSRYWLPLSITAAGLLLLSLWVWIWNLRLRTVVRRATADMRGTVSLLQSTLESTADGILVVDRQGRITAFNKRFQEMWDIPDEVMEAGDNAKALDYVLSSLNEPQGFLNKVRELYAEPEIESLDVIEFRDGRVFERLSRPQLKEGKVVGRVFSYRDITGRKRSEEALKQSEAKFRFLAENMHDIVWTVDLSMKTTYVSPSIEKVLGFTPAERMNQTASEQLTRESFEFAGKKLVEELQNDKEPGVDPHRSIRMELDFRRKDGSIACLESHLSFIRDENSNPIGIYSVSRDITERKQSEEALRESEERYKNFFDNALVGLFRTRLSDGLFVHINTKAAQLLGLPVEEIVGKVRTIDLYRNPEQRKELIGKLKQHGEVYNFEADFILQDGREAAFSFSGKAYPDKDYMEGAVIDITNRKKAEEALRESEERFRIAFATSPDAVNISKLEDGIFVSVNQGFLDLAGYAIEEVIGKSSAELNIWQDLKDRKQFVAGLKEEGSVRNLVANLRGKDGVVRTGLVSATIIMLAGEPHILSVTRDITDLKRVEEALRESHDRFRMVMDSLDQVVYVADMDTHEVLFINQRTREFFGDVEGKMCWQSFHSGQSGPCEFCSNRKLIDDRGEPTGPYVWEFNNLRANGWWEFRDQAIRWVDGRLVRLAIASDITDRKKSEELSRQSDRYRAVADLASGVAHNFNNLLQIIIGNTNLARMKLESGELSDIENNLKEIIESCRFGSETVRRLNRFAKQDSNGGTRDSHIFDLCDVVRQAAAMTAPWWKSGPERAGIKVHLDMKLRDGCLVKGNKNEIFEVLVNLIKNSVEALPKGGDIEVHTLVEEDQVILRLTDTGIGLAEEDLSRLFTPFFTTNIEAGRGLGLATSRSIVNAHGGDIAVTSTQGQGTTFIVSLPLSQEMPEQANITGDPVTDKRLTILVIDDMEPTVNLIKEALGEYKHSLFGAFSGQEGLEILRENPVDLVICDLGMPEMNGWQVGKAMRDFCEEKGSAKVPFILLTGWGDQSGEEHKIVESGVDAVAEKPIDISGLMQVINEIIERRAANKAADQKEST